MSALEALVEAAAGILAADSLEGTLGRIAHHLRALLHYDDLTVYEVDDAAGMLRPVFAVGDWVDEVLGEPDPARDRHHRLGGRATAGRATCRTCARSRCRTSSRARPTTPRPSCACRCWPASVCSAR